MEFEIPETQTQSRPIEYCDYKDERMDKVLLRAKNFCKANGLSLENSLKIIMICQIDGLDESINNCTIEICNSIDNVGRGY